MPPIIFVLRYPLDFDWESDESYNIKIHKRLLEAHELIVLPVPASEVLLTTEATLLKLRVKVMSQRQRMLLFYLLAYCARGRDLSVSQHFGQVLEWCGRAEEVAQSLQDLGAQIDLLELSGMVHRAVSLYWIAAEKCSFALRLLREHVENGNSLDADFEITLAAKTASLDFMLANYGRATKHLMRAEVLLPRATMGAEGRGSLAWINALLHRERNDLPKAVQCIVESAHLYRQLEATQSACRVLALAADITLDAIGASILDRGRVSEDEWARASEYLEDAFRVGRLAEDAEGLQLAELVQSHLDRLHGAASGIDPERRISSVIRQAQRMRDKSLLTEAQTALGLDFLARYDKARAATWFKKALATADSIQAPGLAYRALQGLRQI